MNKKEIMALNPDEYTQNLQNLKEEYFNLRFQHGVGQLENTSTLSKAKKNIARLETLLRAQKLSKS